MKCGHVLRISVSTLIMLIVFSAFLTAASAVQPASQEDVHRLSSAVPYWKGTRNHLHSGGPSSGGQQVNVAQVIGTMPRWQDARKISIVHKIPSVVSIGLPCLTNARPREGMPQCYSPQQLRNAYEITPLLKSGVTGKKRTIVLIEASSIPTLQSDLHTFDQIFGLKDPHLRIIAPFGIPPFNLTAYTEAALDVQLSHSIAPDANIDVIIANYSLQAPTIESIVSALMKATKYAVDHNLGDVISLSFGVNEDCFDSAYYQYQHAILQEARAKHISIVAAAGDAGTAILSCPSPAATSGFYYAKGTTVLDDPLVTLVGGTTLHASVGKGMYQSETTWNANGGATGGGFSRVFFRPLYQSGVTGSRYRGEPDVAWVGDPTTGVPVVISLNGGIYIVPAGGTSMGAPAWAGLVALFDQYAGRRLGFLSAGLYRILQNKHSYSHAFHDIMTGNNTVRVIDLKGNITTITGYDATRGWDAVTGLGTPKAAALAPLLARLVYRNDGTNL